MSLLSGLSSLLPALLAVSHTTSQLCEAALSWVIFSRIVRIILCKARTFLANFNTEFVFGRVVGSALSSH